MTETKRLGRGLEALLGPVSREQAEASGALRELPMTSLRPNPFQPRTRIDEAELTDLANSMQASGLLQPVIVRPRDGGYELIAGERRWRAAERLGWPKIPAVVKEVDDRTLLTLALVENLQRDDLSPIDEAAGYRRLGEEFHAGSGGDRTGRGTGPVHRRQPPPAAPASSRTCRRWCTRSASPPGTPARSSASPMPSRQSALAAEAIEQGWSVREIEAAVAGKRTTQRPAKRGGRPTRGPRCHRRREAGGRRAPQAARHRRAGDRPAAGPRLRHRQLLLQRRSLPPARADTRRTLRRMKGGARGVTVVIQRDGTTRSQTLRFSVWALRLGALAGAAPARRARAPRRALLPGGPRRRAGPGPRAPGLPPGGGERDGAAALGGARQRRDAVRAAPRDDRRRHRPGSAGDQLDPPPRAGPERAGGERAASTRAGSDGPPRVAARRARVRHPGAGAGRVGEPGRGPPRARHRGTGRHPGPGRRAARRSTRSATTLSMGSTSSSITPRSTRRCTDTFRASS